MKLGLLWFRIKYWRKLRRSRILYKNLVDELCKPSEFYTFLKRRNEENKRNEDR